MEHATLDEPFTPELELEAPLWRPARVLAYTALRRRTLERMVRAGTFPPPVLLSARNLAWKAADVLAWVAARPTLTPPPLEAEGDDAPPRRRPGPGRRGRTPAG